MKTQKSYSKHFLSNVEWKIIEPLVLTSKTKRGRKPKYSKRAMISAIFYLLRTGCSWRNLPDEFPPWKTVYTQFRTWKKNGFFQKMNAYLKKKLRELQKQKSNPEPKVNKISTVNIRSTKINKTKKVIEKIKGKKIKEKIKDRKRVIKNNKLKSKSNRSR